MELFVCVHSFLCPSIYVWLLACVRECMRPRAGVYGSIYMCVLVAGYARLYKWGVSICSYLHNQRTLSESYFNQYNKYKPNKARRAYNRQTIHHKQTRVSDHYCARTYGRLYYIAQEPRKSIINKPCKQPAIACSPTDLGWLTEEGLIFLVKSYYGRDSL